MKSRKWLFTLNNKITNVKIPLLALFPLQADAWPHRQPCTMWKGRLIYRQQPLGPQQRELHISQEDWRHIDMLSSRFNDVFRNKKNERVDGKKGFNSRTSPQGAEREKGHTTLLRPSGTTRSLHASSFWAPLHAQLTYISSYHFLTALGSPVAHMATPVSPFPLEHPSHLFPGKARAACLPPSLPCPACPSANRGHRISLCSTDMTSFSITNKSVPVREGSCSPASERPLHPTSLSNSKPNHSHFCMVDLHTWGASSIHPIFLNQKLLPPLSSPTVRLPKSHQCSCSTASSIKRANYQHRQTTSNTTHIASLDWLLQMAGGAMSIQNAFCWLHHDKHRWKYS